MTQSVFTFITPIDPARVSELKNLLQSISESPLSNPDLPFTVLPALHFASLVIFYDDYYGPYLVFENNVDGTPEEYIEELCQVAASGLHRIYGCCLNYNARGPQQLDDLRNYLRQHLVHPNAYHIGNTGRSVERTKGEAAVREVVESYLDESVDHRETTLSAVSIRTGIQNFLRKQPAYVWASNFQPRMTSLERLGPWMRLLGLGVAALILLPVLLPLLAIFVVILRVKEKADPVEIGPPDAEQIKELASAEENVVQNHMASLCYVKPGWFRRTALKLVLYLTNLVARVSTQGKLSGLDSLHFAHWALIDNGRRLLFLTNYDGSWENYLDDFIDKAAIGLTAIWSNTANFPRTRFLLFGGARDEKRFKAIARKTQAYTNVWYSAYPELTVKAIDNNSAIRDDFYRQLDEAETKRWLQRF